jgi:hypothetical protein
MILIGMVTVCFGIPVLIIVVGVVLLWLGKAILSSVMGG